MVPQLGTPEEGRGLQSASRGGVQPEPTPMIAHLFTTPADTRKRLAAFSAAMSSSGY